MEKNVFYIGKERFLYKKRVFSISEKNSFYIENKL